MLRNTYNIHELEEFFQKLLGVSRSEMFLDFIGNISREAKILEVGCNIGNQLLMLQSLGFTNLTGIEINPNALKTAKERIPKATLVQGSATQMPFQDNEFDLVFTSGVLIHIAEEDLKKAVKEIHRCAKTYILGYEYFAPQRLEVTYRGNEDMLWKEDFAARYLTSFPDLSMVKEKKYKYLENENIDQMFLLSK